MKTEDSKSSNPRLLYEYKIYQTFLENSNFPNVHWYGEEDHTNLLVIDRLGKSLQSFMNSKNPKKLTIPEVANVAVQVLKILKDFHANNFIHRDIKPENILFGPSGSSKKLYLIDYGMAKLYKQKPTIFYDKVKENLSKTNRWDIKFDQETLYAKYNSILYVRDVNEIEKRRFLFVRFVSIFV